MSLFNSGYVVEDGTGLNNSTSYVSVADAKQYLNNLGKGSAFVASSDAIIQAFLNNATLYLDTEYNYMSSKLKVDQALQFPRTTSAGIPEKIKYATVELALLIQENNLFYSPADASSTVKEEKIGPIEVKYATAQEFKSYTAKKNILNFIESLIAPYLVSLSDGLSFQRG